MELYGKDYYNSFVPPYDRNIQWIGHMTNMANRIHADLKPSTVLDVGCAKGYLVEALRDLGVQAHGIDISSYAISCVREDIKPYCRVQSITDDIIGTYDLIACIEVMEHVYVYDLEHAIENICNHTNKVLFSSTSTDFSDPTHISVMTQEFWLWLFAKYGYTKSQSYIPKYITPHAMLLER